MFAPNADLEGIPVLLGALERASVVSQVARDPRDVLDLWGVKDPRAVLDLWGVKDLEVVQLLDPKVAPVKGVHPVRPFVVLQDPAENPNVEQWVRVVLGDIQ